AVELEHRSTKTVVRLTPQLGYSRNSSPVQSISFGQTPDITVEVVRHGGQPVLYLFDPKYKLDSETDGQPGDGKPKKVDIDKMHAYRDALRDSEQRRVVRYAAILYPGPEKHYGDRIDALPARPLQAGVLDDRIKTVLRSALDPGSGLGVS